MNHVSIHRKVVQNDGTYDTLKHDMISELLSHRQWNEIL